MKTILLWTVLAAAACTTTPTPTSTTQPGPRPVEPANPPPVTPPTTPPTDHHDHDQHMPPKPAGGAAIGETCGAGDACVAGATCVAYYGIAGPRGPQFKTCEIKCSGKGGSCPDGRRCVTIADGPGSVCR